MVVKLVTYATHSDGTFEDIKNNKFGIDVVVLGWKQKWNGFMDKFKGVRQYLNTLNNDDIVIFIDGFDSQILQSLDEVEKRFKRLNCGVLVSEDPEKPGRYITKKIFGTCKDNRVANSGLYMGYVKHLKKVLDDVLKECENCNDDQRNLNKVCENFDFIKVDRENFVFSNRGDRRACFVQNPGKASFKRYILRGFKEYSQFFLVEFFIIFAILFFVLKKYRLWVVGVFFIFVIIFALFSDTSCL
tara:strand:- start:98 stop:829 length:732 start_codon:yes stop_codon:yes gene_type:complete